MITNKDIIIDLKSYNFSSLWVSIKNIEDSNLSEVLIALKVFLLTDLWQEHIYTKNLLVKFPDIIKDPLTYFLVIFSWISIGDNEKIINYRKQEPENLPLWMKNWLAIELYGRSLEVKKQYILVKAISKKNNKLEEYVKVALLRSLNYKNANLKYLKKLVNEFNLINAKDKLSKTICVLTNITNIDDTYPFENSLIQLAQYANWKYQKGDIVNALTIYDKLITHNYIDWRTLQIWLTLSVSIPQGLKSLSDRVNHGLSIAPNLMKYQGSIISFKLIKSWIDADYISAYNIIKKYDKYVLVDDNDKLTRANKIFFKYIYTLCVYWQMNKDMFFIKNEISNLEKLVVIGESHSLVLSNIKMKFHNIDVQTEIKFIIGTKMYHISQGYRHYANALKEHISKLSSNSSILLCIGEIDTRPDEGIWKNRSDDSESIDNDINSTVSGYIDYLVSVFSIFKIKSITIQGIPAPNYSYERTVPENEISVFLEMIRKVNDKLKSLTLSNGWNFLDVYSATVAEDGKSNKKYHIDGHHLKPSFYQEIDKWLIKP